MASGLIEIISLQDLIRDIKPVYPHGGTWDDTAKFLLDDPIENHTVTLLLEDLQAHGEFRDPIYIGKSYSLHNDGNETEVDSVLNGTHRVVASLIHGAKTIKFVREVEEEEEESSSEEEEYSWVEVEVEFSSNVEGVSAQEGMYTDTFSDEAFSAMRSIRVSDEIWVTCDFSSGNEKGISYYYEGLKDEKLLPLFEEKFLSTLKSYPLLSDSYVSHTMIFSKEEKTL